MTQGQSCLYRAMCYLVLFRVNSSYPRMGQRQGHGVVLNCNPNYFKAKVHKTPDFMRNQVFYGNKVRNEYRAELLRFQWVKGLKDTDRPPS